MKISFVIPVYRNQGSIRTTYQKTIELVKKLNILHEYIFINDGSDDGSLDELKSIQQTDRDVIIIDFSRNFGQVAAIIAGFKAATGDFVVNMSADLQEPIELIESMINKWKDGNEIVICHRLDREDSFIANNASRIFYGFLKLINPQMPKGGFDFMLIGKNALEVLNQIDERNRFIQGDILWLGYPIAFIPYNRLKRPIGKSQWTLGKKIKYFIDGLINTSYIPIRLMSLIGLGFSIIGFIYALIIAYNRFANNTPFTGWAPIMILILIMGGMIMIMLGIIGEYLWRTYDETRKRPIYIIKNK